MKKLLTSALIGLFSVLPLYTFAQEENGDNVVSEYDLSNPELRPLYAPEPMAQPGELTSCFDTYRFGSVYVTIDAALESASQGAPLSFEGTITNDNPYPVADVAVWVKVFRVRSAEKDVNGPDVLAWVPVAEKLHLKAGEVRPLTFVWEIPPDAEPGTYQLATYVNSFDRFELSGLSFTDDIVGSKIEFQVVGEATGAVRFDKASVTVNEQPFYFASFPPIIPPMTPTVPVEATVLNTTNTPFKGTVHWKLYYWDQLSERTLLSETTEELKIHPQASTTLSYLINDSEHTVYYLVGEITSAHGAESIIGVRFGRVDVAEPRFNFVTGTPATEAGPGSVVACIHSTGPTQVLDGRVTLTAYRNGPLWSLLSTVGLGKLAEASYEGPIPGAVYAFAAPLSAAASSYTVTAKLYQEGVLVDEVRVPYCEDGSCSATLTYIVPVLIALLLLVASVVWYRRKKSTTNQSTTV